MTIVFGKIGGERRKIFEGRKEKTMGSNFVQENQPYPPFGRLPRLGRRVLAALAEINPNRHLVALLPRLGRLIPLICFAKGKQANQPSALKSNIPYIFQEKRPSRIFFCGWILALPFIPPFVLAGYPLESGKVYIFCFVSGAGGSWRMWDRF